MNIYTFGTANFSTSAVGLSGYHRDELGWLGKSRIQTMGADGVGSRSVTLAALESPSAPGPQLIRIPFNPGDPFNYYTVEYRRAVGWSGEYRAIRCSSMRCGAARHTCCVPSEVIALRCNR